VVNATKDRFDAKRAVALVRRFKVLKVAKGKKLVTHDLHSNDLSDEEIVSLVVGPSGNLRAPTIARSRSLVVGFSPEAYAEVLGS
jgi:arsenate reductase-like glutaredoxin family protein